MADFNPATMHPGSIILTNKFNSNSNSNIIIIIIILIIIFMAIKKYKSHE
jgi:hypothetical protein